MIKNKFGKSVDINNAYATYRYEHPIDKSIYFEWKILKTYQLKENEIRTNMRDGLPHANHITLLMIGSMVMVI